MKEPGKEFTTIFWATYHGIRASDPDGDVPAWRRHAYMTALNHCIKAGLVEEIGASLVYYYTGEFDELFRGFHFLLKNGKAGPIPRLFWNQVRQRIAQYYSTLALAEKLQQSPKQNIPEFGYTAENILRGSETARAHTLEEITNYRKILTAAGDKDRELRKVEEIAAQVQSGQPRAKPNLPPDSRPMDVATFWSLIAESAKSRRDVTERCERLTQLLSAFKPPAVVKFSKLLHELLHRAYRHDLLAVATIVMGGCSDDSFEYFRAWLILQGEEKYRAALNDPASIGEWVKAKDEVEAEELLSVAEDAYTQLKGDELPESAYGKPPKKLQGEAWKAEDLATLYPALCRRFRFVA